MEFRQAITDAEQGRDCRNGPVGRETIPVGVHGARHLVVSLGRGQQPADLGDNPLLVRPHQKRSSGGDRLGTLRVLAHHEDGLTEAGRLLLDAPGVGQDDGGVTESVHEGVVVHGFHRQDPIQALNLREDRLAHQRVGVQGPHDREIGEQCDKPGHGSADRHHGLPQLSRR